MAFDLTDGSHFNDEVIRRTRRIGKDDEYHENFVGSPDFNKIIHLRRLEYNFYRCESALTAPHDIVEEQFMFCGICGKSLKGLEKPAGFCLKCQRDLVIHKSTVYRIFFKKEGLWASNLIESGSPLMRGRNFRVIR